MKTLDSSSSFSTRAIGICDHKLQQAAADIGINAIQHTTSIVKIETEKVEKMQYIARRRHRRKIPCFSLLLLVASFMSRTRSVNGFLFSSPAFTDRSAQSVMFVNNMADDGYDGLGEYDPSERLRPSREVLVGDPQLRVIEKDRSVTSILRELAAIQQQGPQKYCILGTRHCSYLHQQIIELL